MHPRFRLGPTGDRGIQEESDRRGGHVLGVEEKQGSLVGVWGVNGGVLFLSPHGEYTRNIPAIDQWGRHWRWRTGDIHGFIFCGY